MYDPCNVWDKSKNTYFKNYMYIAYCKEPTCNIYNVTMNTNKVSSDWLMPKLYQLYYYIANNTDNQITPFPLLFC